jgi:hypothetical protein
VNIRSGGTAAGDAPEARDRSAADVDDNLDCAVDADLEDLPGRRRVSPGRVVHQIRRMDDPEILERVLAGLLSLP